jgi:hypothetical protein
MSLRGYDNWKTHNPADDYLGDAEEDCICTTKRSRYCPVHGINQDQALDELRDRQMERDD